MSQLYIPNSIALCNFDSIFKNNTFNFSDKKIAVSFHPKYVAMHPIGLAFYAALGDYWKENNCELTGKINKISTIPYLQRMGLFRALGFLDPKKIETHEESGRFIPLTKIHNGDDLNSFMRNVIPLLHTSEDNAICIKHVFSEMIRNVIEHSRTNYGANVCATYNKNSRKISIGISDNGIGLFKSLVTYHSIHNDKEALEKALTPGISGTTARIGGSENNAGAGLFYTKCIAQTTRNHMLLYSGTSYYKLLTSSREESIVFHSNPSDDKCKYREGLPSFNGTLLGIDINIDDSKAFFDLMSNIGAAYRNSINKSKKDYYRRIHFI